MTDYGVSGVAPGEPAPIPDAVAASGVAVSVQIPMRADETWEEGDIEAQTTVCLDNLRTTLAGMGLGLDRVMHVTVYLTDMADWA
ncbi:MAG: RidA family protein, partial [bacterium]|nr:RidA family protein [bacterium]